MTAFIITMRFKICIRRVNQDNFTFPDVNQISRANSDFLLSLTSGTNGRPRFRMDPERYLETILSPSLLNLTPLMSNVPTYIALNVIAIDLWSIYT